jgi:hypothetical protein
LFDDFTLIFGTVDFFFIGVAILLVLADDIDDGIIFHPVLADFMIDDDMILRTSCAVSCYLS